MRERFFGGGEGAYALIARFEMLLDARAFFGRKIAERVQLELIAEMRAHESCSLCAEFASELAQRKRKPALDRSERFAESFRDFAVRQAAEIRELECPALLRRQRVERAAHACALDMIRNLELRRRLAERFACFDRAMTRIGSPSRQRFIPHASDEKRAQRTAFRRIGIAILPDAHEYVMHAVLRVVRRAQHVHRDGETHIRVRPVDLVEVH